MFCKMPDKTRLFGCAVLATVALLLLSPLGATAATKAEQVKFTLKSDAADSTAIDVNLSFKMSAGQKAVIKPSEQTGQPVPAGAPPTLEPLSQSNPSFVVEPLQGPSGGWIVTAASDGAVQFAYKVKFAP